MKALGRGELRELKDRATVMPPGQTQPWPVARARAEAPAAEVHADFASPQLAPGDGRRELPPVHGIERRLVRRVEALWHSLCEDDGLPPVSSLATLLAEPYGSQAALFRIPSRAPGKRAAAVPHFVGNRLQAVGGGKGATRSALMRRLGLLASEALAGRRPAYFDSELESPGIRADSDGPALMVRAIALPVRQTRGSAASIVVVASWREILSARDTQALQQELATAIAWMQAHAFSGPT